MIPTTNGLPVTNRPLSVAARLAGILVLFLLAGWGGAFAADDDALVLGVFPRRSVSQTAEMFGPIAAYLSESLDRKVRLETAHDFLSFWDAVAMGRYDIVHYNQYHYVRAHKEYGHRVIVRNEEFNRSALAGSLVTRKDSGIKSLADLKGQKIIFGGGKNAMMSYIVAKYLLLQAGLRDSDYISQFALNPPKACVAVYYRQAAAAGVGHIVLQLPVVKDQIDVDEMRYLGRSEPLAHLPWAVAGSITPELEKRIRSALLALNRTGAGRSILRQAGLTGLSPASDKDYDPHRRIIRLVTGQRY